LFYLLFIGDPIQEEKVRIPLIGFTLPHFCACPKPGPGFSKSYVMFFFHHVHV
jgi:hypothetical protein